MPVINAPPYTGNNHQRWNTSFDLDHFQRYSLDAYDKGHNVLVTAHTGSGKTLPAEYAIVKAVSNGKRAIYTAPIKTLSNQKYHELSRKYPDISFGILTGDVKHNPDADCLIMTTEILRNTLFQQKMSNHTTPLFEIGASDSIGCIIFDEVHYINDPDRGCVWEEAIILTPPSTQIVMLSATINHPENFASWVETATSRTVEICSTDLRAVPLTHHVLITFPESATKCIENATTRSTLEQNIMVPLTIKIPGQSFNEAIYNQGLRTMKTLYTASKGRKLSTNKHSLQQAVEHLRDNTLLPAIAFVFSRKQVEEYGKHITLSLSDDPSTAEADFESKVRSLSNSHEHINSQEYETLRSLIRRGIAIHHSGMVPVLKEAVELMFALGHVKLLIATETFAVGVNMPAKAVLFTSLRKPSGQGWRNLYAHEYTQMAGRAGRRGLDPVGRVFILPCMERKALTAVELNNIVCGSSPTIESKFKIHFNLILRLALANHNPVEFTTSSMVSSAIEGHVKDARERQVNTEGEIASITMTDILRQYRAILADNPLSQSKKRDHTRQLREFERQYPNIIDQHKSLSLLENALASAKADVEYTQSYIPETIRLAFNCLEKRGFTRPGEDGKPIVTRVGILAANIQEVHSLVMAETVESGLLSNVTSHELAAILSVFSQVRTREDPNIKSTDPAIHKQLVFIEDRLHDFQSLDAYYQFDIAEDYNFNTVLCNPIMEWCRASCEADCQAVYARLFDASIFKGEFIKSVLKICSIATELENVALLAGQAKLSEACSQIPALLQKSVATNQSLYLTE